MTNPHVSEFVTTVNLDAIGHLIGLTRRPGECANDFASRCHYRVDAMMREHAHLVGETKFVELMDLHDAIEDCFPVTSH
ncbi:hypothetical protein [Hyphomicrobium sp.]|uniref:hypothetical protein n=1 Tax=Hyphomicrobium sp. TaxID=82 RepID=UPI002E2F9403|nr:hypothetical protein [Hyphomicrobium sp.]HEX2841389.1 hypothetical protein [Hyphomicrobium sp.]